MKELDLHQYATIPEWAKLHGQDPSNAHKYLLRGRIPGAVWLDTLWIVPKDAPLTHEPSRIPLKEFAVQQGYSLRRAQELAQAKKISPPPIKEGKSRTAEWMVPEGAVITQDIPYFTLRQYCEKHHLDHSYTHKLVVKGRLTGAVQVGKTWVVPKDAQLLHQSKEENPYERWIGGFDPDTHKRIVEVKWLRGVKRKTEPVEVIFEDGSKKTIHPSGDRTRPLLRGDYKPVRRLKD